jgi:hypothetical protein
MTQTRWTGVRNVLRLATLALAAVLVTLAAPGCCKYDEECCNTATERQVTHTIAIAESMVDCGGPAVTCVCSVPKRIKVRQGDKVIFVNTTDYKVMIQPAVDGAFTDLGNIDIAAKSTAIRTIVSPVPAALKPGIGTDLVVDPPGKLCSGYPGPGIDFD